MTVLEAVASAGIFAAALTAIGGLIAGVWWIVRRLVHIADAVTELAPNGGHSLKDQVTRIETKLGALDEKVGTVEQQMTDHIAEHEGASQDG